MNYLNQTINMLVSSDPKLGAVNVSADGSAFELQLEEPLELPKNAQNVLVSVPESQIWWVMKNIEKDKNDMFYIYGDDDQGGQQLFEVEIPPGLYDLNGLDTALQSGLEALGARTEDSNGDTLPLVYLTADNSTQKVKMRVNYTNVYVDYSPPDTCREILGFEPLVYGPYPAAPLDIPAPNVAAFNQINYLLIQSDLVTRGIRYNNKYNQILSQVSINVAPGSQIINKPWLPAQSHADELAGSKRSVLRFRITDQNLRPVDTNGEYWSSRIAITYQIPVIAYKNM